MQCDPQTATHTHTHWASRQSEAYFGLMCRSGFFFFGLRDTEATLLPSLLPSCLPLPRFVFLPRVVTLIVCQTKRAHFLFCFFFLFSFLVFRSVRPTLVRLLLLALTMQSGSPPAPRPEPRRAVSHQRLSLTLAATIGPPPPRPLPPPRPPPPPPRPSPPPPSGAHCLRGLHCSATFIES